MATVHVIGAGLAGLNCALRLAEQGATVSLYEATGHAGGRCRSYFDRQLERWIDNGNHLIFSGNSAARDFLQAIGTPDSMIDPGRPIFPFIDLANGKRWTVRLNEGRLPWWVAVKERRVPGTRMVDYLALTRFAYTRAKETVSEAVPPSHPLFRTLIEPFAVAVLNATADEGAGRLLWPVIRESFGRGGHACRPLIAREGLSMSLVDPAVERLQQLGVSLQFVHRLREFALRGHQVTSLSFIGHDVPVAEDDAVVLAVPHRMAALLVPDLPVPEGSRAIVNAHYRLPAPVPLHEGLSFLAVLGGTAHWLFFRGDVVSATVSAADNLVDLPAEEIAASIWADVARAVDGAPAAMPAWRI